MGDEVAAKKTTTARKGVAARKRAAPGKGRGMAAGRRVVYRAEFAGQVEKLCKLGAGDEEVAEFFGVGVEVLEKWRRERGEFDEAVRRGKMLADAEVADRLFLRAVGYSREGVKVMARGGKEGPAMVPCEEYYAPDVRACIFWLKNRRPDLWGERVLDAGDGDDGEAMVLRVSEEALEEMRGMVGVAKGVGGMGEVPGDQ